MDMLWFSIRYTTDSFYFYTEVENVLWHEEREIVENIVSLEDGKDQGMLVKMTLGKMTTDILLETPPFITETPPHASSSPNFLLPDIGSFLKTPPNELKAMLTQLQKTVDIVGASQMETIKILKVLENNLEVIKQEHQLQQEQLQELLQHRRQQPQDEQQQSQDE